MALVAHVALVALVAPVALVALVALCRAFRSRAGPGVTRARDIEFLGSLPRWGSRRTRLGIKCRAATGNSRFSPLAACIVAI